MPYRTNSPPTANPLFSFTERLFASDKFTSKLLGYIILVGQTVLMAIAAFVGVAAFFGIVGLMFYGLFKLITFINLKFNIHTDLVGIVVWIVGGSVFSFILISALIDKVREQRQQIQRTITGKTSLWRGSK